jgi:choline dehydrogenase-like flavoprotein
MIVAKELATKFPSKSIIVLEGGSFPEAKAASESWQRVAQKLGVQAPSIFEVPGEYENIAWSQDRAYAEYSWASPDAWIDRPAHDYDGPTEFSYQGKLFGGSAAVNKMIFIQPSHQELLNMGFDANEVEGIKASFNAIKAQIPPTNTPSADGKVYAGQSGDIVNQALKAYMKDQGVDFQDAQDFNWNGFLNQGGSRKNYYGYPPQMTMGGKRANSYNTFDKTKFPNVKLQAEAQVTRLTFDPLMPGHVKHVVYLQRGSPNKAYSAMLSKTGKVIMTAGALNTPRLLLLSGVGSWPDLMEYGPDDKGFFQTKQSDWRGNSGVGMEIQDHTMAMIGFRKSDGLDLFDPTDRSADATLNTQNDGAMERWLVNKTGPYCQYGPTSMAYLQSATEAQSGSNQPDLQIHTLPHAVEKAKSVRYLKKTGVQGPLQTVPTFFQTWGDNAWVTYITLLKTKSKGKFKLSSIFGDKRVTYDNGSMYLSDPDDMQRLQQGMSTVVAALTAPTMQHMGIELKLPNSTRPQDVRAAVDNWQTSHLVANSFSGTCKLNSCVDKNFLLYNTTNVYVADASALPGQPPVQPVATVMALAHYAAGKIAAQGYVSVPQPGPLPAIPAGYTGPTSVVTEPPMTVGTTATPTTLAPASGGTLLPPQATTTPAVAATTLPAALTDLPGALTSLPASFSEFPTQLPSEFPSEFPSNFPTGLPADLTSLPASFSQFPTQLPTATTLPAV